MFLPDEQLWDILLPLFVLGGLIGFRLFNKKPMGTDTICMIAALAVVWMHHLYFGYSDHSFFGAGVRFLAAATITWFGVKAVIRTVRELIKSPTPDEFWPPFDLGRKFLKVCGWLLQETIYIFIISMTWVLACQAFNRYLEGQELLDTWLSVPPTMIEFIFSILAAVSRVVGYIALGTCLVLLVSRFIRRTFISWRKWRTAKKAAPQPSNH